MPKRRSRNGTKRRFQNEDEEETIKGDVEYDQIELFDSLTDQIAVSIDLVRCDKLVTNKCRPNSRSIDTNGRSSSTSRKNILNKTARKSTAPSKRIVVAPRPSKRVIEDDLESGGGTEIDSDGSDGTEGINANDSCEERSKRTRIKRLFFNERVDQDVIPEIKIEVLDTEYEKHVFERAFVPWFESISHWYRCDDCGGKEMENEKIKKELKSKDTIEVASNEFMIHEQQFPGHKVVKLYRCIFPLPPRATESTSTVTNCDRKYTDIRQMHDHVERAHYDQVISCPSYKSFLSQKPKEHVNIKIEDTTTTRPRGRQRKTTTQYSKPAGTKVGVRGWCEGSEGNFCKIGFDILEELSDDDLNLVEEVYDEDYEPEENINNKKKKRAKRWPSVGPIKRQKISLSKEDAEYFSKVSAGTYCRIVMVKDSYDDIITKKEYLQKCENCKFCFTDINEYYFHNPCYEERRDQQRIDHHREHDQFYCEICQRIFATYQNLIKHKHNNPSFSCNLCDHWSNTYDLAIIHTQVHTKEKIFKCIFEGCERGFIGWQDCSRCRDHIFKVHIFADTDRNTCRDKNCREKFKSPKERAKHEQNVHPILFFWDDDTYNSKSEAAINDPVNTTTAAAASSDGTITPSEPPSTSQHSPITMKEDEPIKQTRIAKKRVMSMSDFLKLKNKTVEPVKVIIPEFIGDEKEQETQRNLWLRQFIKIHPTPEVNNRDLYQVVPFEQSCNLCNRSFTSKVNFIIHKPCYYVKRSRQLMEQGIEEAARYECDVCSLTFNEMDRLRDHMSYHLEPSFICDFDQTKCTSKFQTREGVLIHAYRRHLKFKQYQCIFDPGTCQLAQFSLKSCRDHVLAVHLKIHSIKCDVEGCTYTTNDIRTLRRHKQKHNNPRSFVCPVDGCNQAFNDNRSRLKHIRRRHPEYDINLLEKLKKPAKRRVDGKMEVINGQAVVVENSSYTPFEAEMRRAMYTKDLPDLEQELQYL